MAFGLDGLIKILGMGLMGKGFFGGGSDQDRESFSGEQRGNLSLDPRDIFGQSYTAFGRFGADLYDRLHDPIYLPSAYAQDLPTFTGGGLPMPIGALGRDLTEAPAEKQGVFLRRPGIASPRRDVFQGIGNLMSGDPTASLPDTSPPESDATGGSDAFRRRGGFDPFNEAYAAIDLLTRGRG